MNGFEKYIQKHYVPKGDAHNFVLLTGGRVNILDKPLFLEKYLKSFPSFSAKYPGALVFKVPKNKLYPLILDIDVDLSREVSLEEDLYLKLTQYILDQFTNVTGATEGVEVVLSRRPGSCYKKKKCLASRVPHVHYRKVYSATEYRVEGAGSKKNRCQRSFYRCLG